MDLVRIVRAEFAELIRVVQVRPRKYIEFHYLRQLDHKTIFFGLQHLEIGTI